MRDLAILTFVRLEGQKCGENIPSERPLLALTCSRFVDVLAAAFTALQWR
jgi:hypothetical protein